MISWSDGAPVAGAELVFEHEGATVSTRSDDEGAFTLEPSAAGTHSLVVAHAEGFLPFAPSWGQSPVRAEAHPGRHVVGIVVRLVPALAYDGRVVDTEGGPVADAQVRLLEGGGDAPLPLDDRFVSDVNGHFAFSAPDGAILEARHPDHGVTRAALDRSAQIARTLTLRFSGDDGAELGQHSLAGRVLSGDVGLEGALVVATFQGRGRSLHPPMETLSDGEGRFRLEGLDPGRYRVRASAEGHGPTMVGGVAVDRDNVVLRLLPEARVSGRVVDPEGTPVASFAISVERVLGALQRRGAATAVRYDAEGRFDVGGLSEGTHAVRATAHGFAESEPLSVELSRGRAVDVGALQLTRAGSVAGIVRSGDAPLADARVSLEGRLGSEGPALADTALSGADGRFLLEGIGAGLRSITVAAHDHHARIVSGLVIAPGATVTVEVDLTPTEEGERPQLELAGIGAMLRSEGDALVVQGVVEGGGAESAGLLRGDQILRVDGAPVTELGFQGSIERIRGPEGSRVRLDLRRGDAEVALEVSRLRIRVR